MLAKVAGRKDPNRRKEPGEPGERQGTRALAGLGPVPRSGGQNGLRDAEGRSTGAADVKARGQVLRGWTKARAIGNAVQKNEADAHAPMSVLFIRVKESIRSKP